MAADIHSREQRLRKRAELQSLYGNLASLREREASYIAASAVIPELLLNQINEQRQQIEQLENELLALDDETIQKPARQSYREAFEAEQSNELEKAQKLYKNAARSAHPDAEAALRSIRYQLRTSRNRVSTASQLGALTAKPPSKNRFWIGLILILILLLGAIVTGYRFWFTASPEANAVKPTSTTTPTPPSVILIVPDTPTSVPTETSTATSTFTPSPSPTPAESATATPSPPLESTLRPAPQILEPKDGLVWSDGAIVFEFKKLDLAYDELYCLNTMRGYDKTLTENWSFPPVGNKIPAIPIESNVFRVAKLQGMECIVWSAAIGKGSCDNLISQSTEERVIGLPQPCNIK